MTSKNTLKEKAEVKESLYEKLKIEETKKLISEYPEKLLTNIRNDWFQTTLLVGLIVIASLVFSGILILVQDHGLIGGDYQTKNIIINKEIVGNSISVEYFSKLSTRDNAKLILYVQNAGDTNFSGTVFGKDVNVENFYLDSGREAGADLPFENILLPVGQTSFELTACQNASCEKFEGKMEIYDFESSQFNRTIILLFLLLVAAVCFIILYLQMRKITLLKDLFGIILMAGIFFLFNTIHDMVPSEYKFYLVVPMVFTALLFFAQFVHIFLLPGSGQILLAAAFYSIFLWFFFIYVEPIFGYLILLIILSIAVIFRKSENKIVHYGLILTLLSILLSSFFFQPIVQPIVVEKSLEERIILPRGYDNNGFPQVDALLNAKIRPPLIGFFPFGTSDVRFNIGKDNRIEMDNSDCDYQLFPENGKIIAIPTKRGIQDCNLLVHFTYTDSHTNGYWDNYVWNSSEYEIFSDIGADGETYTILRLTYKGHIYLDGFRMWLPGSDKENQVFVNGKVGHWKIPENGSASAWKVAILSVEPNSEYVIIYPLSGKKLEGPNASIIELYEKYGQYP